MATFLELRQRVSYRLDQATKTVNKGAGNVEDIPRAADNLAFWTREQVGSWINEGLRQVWSSMSEIESQSLLVEGTLAYAADTRRVSIFGITALSSGPDPLKILHVADITNNSSGHGSMIPYAPFQQFESYRNNADSLTSRSTSRMWSYGGSNPMYIYMDPRPSNALTLRVSYIDSEPTAMVVDTANDATGDTTKPTFLPAAHHDLLVDFAVIQAKLKEEDPSWKDDDRSFQKKLGNFIQSIDERQQQTSRSVIVSDYEGYSGGVYFRG